MVIEIQRPSYITFEHLLRGDHQERLIESMGRFSHDPVVIRALSILRLLPGRRCYHNAAHTAAVVWVVTAIGVDAELDDNELRLNAHAAAFHDIGFAPIVSGGQDVGHEEAGATFAGVALQDMGFDPAYADRVSALIRDTALVKESSGIVHQRTEGTAQLSSYPLLDADVHNLGTNTFLAHLLALFNERNDLQINCVADLLTFEAGKEYLRETLNFISYHRWATPIAAAWFGEKKAENILELKKILEQVPEH